MWKMNWLIHIYTAEGTIAFTNGKFMNESHAKMITWHRIKMKQHMMIIIIMMQGSDDFIGGFEWDNKF